MASKKITGLKKERLEKRLYRSLWTNRPRTTQRIWIIRWNNKVHKYYSWQLQQWTTTPDSYDFLTEDEVNALIKIVGKGVKVQYNTVARTSSVVGLGIGND